MMDNLKIKIPKTIHYCWFGRNPLPSLAIKCIASWKKYLPDYEIKEWNEDNFDITKSDLVRLGLLMGSDSRQRREYLGEELRIGYSNGKQLLKRLELFGVTLAEVETLIKDYERKQHGK